MRVDRKPLLRSWFTRSGKIFSAAKNFFQNSYKRSTDVLSLLARLRDRRVSVPCLPFLQGDTRRRLCRRRAMCAPPIITVRASSSHRLPRDRAHLLGNIRPLPLRRVAPGLLHRMAPAVLRAQARLHPLADAPARPRRKVPVRGQCSNAGPPPLLYALAAAAVTARFAGLLCRYIAYIEPFLVRHQADVDGSVATLLQRAGEFQIHDLGKFGSLAATKGEEAVALYRHAAKSGGNDSATAKKHI